MMPPHTMSQPLAYDAAVVAHHPEATRAQKISWVLYDWANSGYGLIILGPLFSPYFTGTLLPEQPSMPPGPHGEISHGLMLGSTSVPASAVFAVMTSAVALLVTVSAPVLGALADLRGWTKGLLIATATIGSLIACCAIFLGPGQWVGGAVIYIVSSFFFATSLTFYNAYLPLLTGPDKQGRLSG